MISGVVLARNEESNIVACIDSIRPHVTEIILIDMESGDATVELARPIVDKRLNHELVANFDSAQQASVLFLNDKDVPVGQQQQLDQF